jgi:23S rRNA pseudouridine1911/1915/1917 synthase
MFNTDNDIAQNDVPLSQTDLLPEPEVQSPSRWQITTEQAGIRLDRYLPSQLPALSRTLAQQMIAECIVLVNNKTSKAGYILRVNDDVQLLRPLPTSQQKNVLPQSLPLVIVYEDADLLVINKAAGMVVHPAPGHSDDTLVNALVALYPELQQEDGDQRPGIVHRLDRDTSGLLLVAKNARTQAALIEQMKRHEITKRYLALVDGVLALDKGSIDAPVGRNPRNRQQMTIIHQDGREARTHFRVLERFSRHTLLLLQLETGRTHQIRVHLRAIGHSVFGDPVYNASSPGRSQLDIPLTRQFLHAYQLEFIHPTTGEALQFEAPLPADLSAVLDQRDKL